MVKFSPRSVVLFEPSHFHHLTVITGSKKGMSASVVNSLLVYVKAGDIIAHTDRHLGALQGPSSFVIQRIL